MTPFEASRCLLFLLLGWKDEYFRLLGLALEQEDPLSRITLELALCGSDTEAAISFLQHDPAVQAIREEVILRWLKDMLYEKYCQGNLLPDDLSRTYLGLSTSYDIYDDLFWYRVEHLLEYRENGFLTEKEYQDGLQEMFELDQRKKKEGEALSF